MTVAPQPEQQAPAFSLNDLLVYMSKQHASDLHLKPMRPPLVRVQGKLIPIKTDALKPADLERMLLPLQTLRNELLFLYPVMWLNALGIYIGRYLRYNSWDVVTDPFQLLRDIAVMIIHPLRHQNTWDMVLCFSILMTLIYLMMKKISKALN